jgi:hypothetical protein
VSTKQGGDRRSVNAESTRQLVDRLPLAVCGDELCDFRVAESMLALP